MISGHPPMLGNVVSWHVLSLTETQTLLYVTDSSGKFCTDINGFLLADQGTYVVFHQLL